MTDTGEVVREESPLGLITVRESPESARAMAVSRRMQVDLLRRRRSRRDCDDAIDDPRDVRRIRIRLDGADLTSADLAGGGQKVDGDIVELVDPR